MKLSLTVEDGFKFMVDTKVLSTKKVSGTSASYNWSTSNLSVGVHTLTVSVADAAGDTGSASEQVTR
jgi:hypothetical protein